MILDYEQKYKEALERARKIENGEPIKVLNGTSIPVAIFPELKEFEDEKVIRDIKVVLECSATKFFKEEGKMPIWYDRAVAWLEKLSEQTDIANKEYWRGYREGKQEILDKYAELEKQGEQKSVWHDKDEEPCEDRQVLICLSGNYYVDFYHKEDKRFYMFCKPKHYLHEIEKWAYLDDLLEKQGNEKDIHLMELKAKAYDDAKKRMSRAYNQNRVHIGFIHEIFPNLNLYENQGELKNIDSDDLATLEIWKDAIKENKEKWQLSDWFVEATSLLIQKVKRIENNESINIKDSRVMLNACINVLRTAGHSHLSNWLEKQGEQKPVEWCSEDEQNLNVCLSYIPHEFLRRWLKDIIHIKYDKPIDMVEPKFHKGEWITIKE